MFCPAKKGYTEEDYYYSEWTATEKEAGEHLSVMKFVRPCPPPGISAASCIASLPPRGIRGRLRFAHCTASHGIAGTLLRQRLCVAAVPRWLAILHSGLLVEALTVPPYSMQANESRSQRGMRRLKAESTADAKVVPGNV